jgi:hypothetical protein
MSEPEARLRLSECVENKMHDWRIVKEVIVSEVIDQVNT